ncbi:MAG TPA: PmoA family protein, partial [Candidatus Hydrogenedentes bacterium]|nr:PmoA family protein [Candidatus Hydrogenedentota bacterium]
LVGLASLPAVAREDSPGITFHEVRGNLDILVHGKPFATYVYEDPEIPRPYFCRVMAPNGVQVTRNQPPDPAQDEGNLDHPTFHPGIWLAFGDLGGADFWRNKARVRHVRFDQAPRDGAVGTFAVVNAYETLDTPPRLIAEEICAYSVRASQDACWLIAESRFRAVAENVAFGDQEEMGFGVRLATPLTVKHGSGNILNNLGGKNEAGTWGRQADWCAFSGIVDGRRAGILLAANPNNFRPSWFHNRDYGVMVVNPFGKKSMTGPKDDAVPPDATPVDRDAPFVFGFAACVSGGDSEAHPDYDALYAEYRSALGALTTDR